MTKLQYNNAIQHTVNWLTQSVIQYQLCPYAKQPHENQAICYRGYAGSDIIGLLETLAHCCIELDNHSPKTLETTLLIIAPSDKQTPHSQAPHNTPDTYLADFYDYLDALGVANDFLATPQQFTPHFSNDFQKNHAQSVPVTWENTYQLASFHPDYQFENTDIDDRENYTNRSPYPLFHLIRNAAIEDVRINDQQAKHITQRNIDTMNQLSEQAFNRLQQLAKS